MHPTEDSQGHMGCTGHWDDQKAQDGPYIPAAPAQEHEVLWGRWLEAVFRQGPGPFAHLNDMGAKMENSVFMDIILGALLPSYESVMNTLTTSLEEE